jgi:hypothetical protein
MRTSARAGRVVDRPSLDANRDAASTVQYGGHSTVRLKHSAVPVQLNTRRNVLAVRTLKSQYLLVIINGVEDSANGR